MSSTLEVVEKHFDREAERFDAIYEASKPLHHRLMDRFRRIVVDRFNLIRNLAPSAGPWTVLDVGCGSGRYAIALAQAGAVKVLGVDVSGNMIALARIEAERGGVAAQCEFTQAGFLACDIGDRYDVVVATGYFDYVEDARPHLTKMARYCRGRIFASFPKRWEIRVPIRMLRFALHRSYVRFYSQKDVRRAFRDAGIAEEQLSLIDLGRDWIAVANVR